MNEDIVYKMIKPYIRDNTLTYSVFYRLFDVLKKPEQYAVINLIEDKFNIQLIDDIDEYDPSGFDEPEADSKEFDALYDKGAFANSVLPESDDLGYKQANEILCALIQQGNEAAKQAICIKNKRLVWKYAFAYNKYYGNDLDMEDLAQAGFLGLLKAAERFDVSLGNTFSTYCVWWIRQSITRELVDKGFTIRLPVHIFEKISKLVKLDNQYDGMGYSFAERVALIARDLQLSEERVLELFSIKYRYLSLTSLDVPVGEAEDTPLLELVEDTIIEDTDYFTYSIELHSMLEKALKHLNPREEKVMRLRFGFDDGIPRTLEEVGNILGVTRERVRQIENKSLRKLFSIMMSEGNDCFFDS